MRNFVLHELLLVSQMEKRARRIEFDPATTVIVGGNDTGKSSVLKSIYSTFGADPPMIHPTWRLANVTSVVVFSIDGETYSVLRSGDTHFAIFDANQEILGTFSRVTFELAPFVAALFGFHIKLPDQKGQLVTPPPAFLFLPFYVDQDSGWARNWSSFARLQQLQNWRKAVAEYHAGIRPNEYYLIRGELELLKQETAQIGRESSALQKVREKVRSQLPPANFDLNLKDFGEEVAALLKEAQSIKSLEEDYKNRLVGLHSQRHVVEVQIAITTQAVKEIRADYDYAAERLEAHVDCPTCGATYENGFSERFAIATDEDRLHDLLLQLRSDAQKLDESIRETNEKYAKTRTEVNNIDRLLATRKGDVTLQTLIVSEGQKEVQSVLKNSVDEYYRRVAELDRKAADAQESLKATEDRDRQKQIRDFYFMTMRGFLHELDVQQIKEHSFKNMWAQVKETGSDLPRALLAFYLSYLMTVQRYSTATFCPIVMDELNQQGQDEENLPKMIEFVLEKQPKGSQLILGLEALHGVEPRGKVIELSTKFRVLTDEDFEGVNARVSALLDKSLRHANEIASKRLFD